MLLTLPSTMLGFTRLAANRAAPQLYTPIAMTEPLIAGLPKSAFLLQVMTMNPLVAFLVSATLVLTTACGSESGKSGGTSGPSNMGGASKGGASNTGGTTGTSTVANDDPCMAGICAPIGVPFVTRALAISDTCGKDCPVLAADTPVGETTSTLSQPEPGKLCLSGVVSPGGWAQIGLLFAVKSQDRTEILKTFDARVLGITQVAFTIDSPPSGGVSVDAAITTAMSCPSDPFGCFTYGFNLMTAPGSSVPANFATPGPVVAPFANFMQTVSTHSFDTSALEHLVFSVGTGSYDFCIHDFMFLDAEGNEVKDTQPVDSGI